MPEYKNVEQPFLEKLADIGWQVIDQGSFGIPADPLKSLRSSFKQVTLPDVFKASILNINPWLSSKQLVDLYQEMTETERGHLSLLEANKVVFEKLIGKTKTTVSQNEKTGEQNPLVRLIDFEDWENNTFTAINQFRIVTPGGPREGIIPDIVLFVNGLPIAVIECKDVDTADPLSEGIRQIQRYANQRESEGGLKEGEERLFHYNLFSITTHGEEARFGTITGDYEYYLNWKDIFPVKYRDIDKNQYAAEEEFRYYANGLQKDPQVRQEVLIAGMLNKEILLDVLRHFSLFMEIKEGVEIKIVCRYQQYRAVGKILNRLRRPDPAKRSGVVWHTQGSGKSLTMVFLVRKLRSQADLKDYKVLFTVDRKSLQKQLTETAKLTGEFKESNIVDSRKDLAPKLSNNSPDLSLVMIHKFVQEELKHSKALMKAYVREGEVPKFKPFEVVNESDRIVILIDEAHRSQGGDMGDNLFAAFPHAAKIAFTGTPLLTQKAKQKTHERFGGDADFIDTYKIREAVDDRATLDIKYIGKTTKDLIYDKEAFDAEFEDVFNKQDKDLKGEIQKRYGTMQAYLENEDRIKNIAIDIVEHYVKDILPNGYKAMVVANSILAAARYEKYLSEAIDHRIAIETIKDEPDQQLIEQMMFLQVCTEVTQQDNNELGLISEARQKAKRLKAVDNFKKDYHYKKNEAGQYIKPETGIGMLCVCDRLLTGFDAPIAQVMYLDKNLREHNLMQAIARVNRTKGTKDHGIIVDYFGVSNHLKEALGIYGSEDQEDIKELLTYFSDINKEIPVLEARFNRMIQLFEDKGVTAFRAFAAQTITDKDHEFEIAEQCIDLAESVAFRAQFDTYVKAFFDSLDLLFNSKVARDYYIPAKRFGYLLIRIRNRYKDASLELKWAKAKVRKLIDKYLLTLGIDSKVEPIFLLSDKFPAELSKLGKNNKSKASEMEHAIRRHIKVNLDKDPVLYSRFKKRLEDIIERYQSNWDNIVDEFTTLRNDMKEVRPPEITFHDMISSQVSEKRPLSDDEVSTIDQITNKVMHIFREDMDKPGFWSKAASIKKMKGNIEGILEHCGIKEIETNMEALTISLAALAKRRHDEIIDTVDE